MTLVLTGASGFLGNNLNKFLVKKNYRVVRLNLRYFNKINKINIFNKLNRIKNLSAIINCAASLNPKSSSDFEVNENLPEIFQNYSKEKKIKFIHISSINVLIKNRRDKYSLSKKRGEQDLSKKHSTILRLPLIIKTVKKKLLNEGEIRFFYNYLDSIRLPIYPLIFPGCYYKPIEINYVCKYILNLLNRKTNHFVNLQGKYRMSFYDIFNFLLLNLNRKIVKVLFLILF